MKEQFAILGTAIRHGQPKPGVERSYEYLELVGFWKELSEEYEFENWGALEIVSADRAYYNLFHKTLELINQKKRPLLIGGDHSQAFASVSAILNKYPELRIIWVDAHADLNTPGTSPSGNSHGMPLSGLLGLVDKSIWGQPWMNQLLRPNQVAQFGVRDVDTGEQKFIDDLNIEVYSPAAIRERGLKNLIEDLSQRWKGYPVHLSFDIDGLDSALVPATGTPVGEGLDMAEAQMIVSACKDKFNLVSAELVEFNPDLAKNPDQLAETEKNVKQLIRWILEA